MGCWLDLMFKPAPHRINRVLANNRVWAEIDTSHTLASHAMVLPRRDVRKYRDTGAADSIERCSCLFP